MNTCTHAQIHRFGDTVAVYLGNGATTYLDATMARKIARLLNGCAKSIDREEFAHSSFGSHEIDAPKPKPQRMFRVGAQMANGTLDYCFVHARNARHAKARVGRMRGVARAISATVDESPAS